MAGEVADPSQRGAGPGGAGASLLGERLEAQLICSIYIYIYR